MSSLLELLVTLFTVGVILFFLMALSSPFETLGWWAGWTKRTIERELSGERAGTEKWSPTDREAVERPPGTSAGPYLVYLRGIATAEAAPSQREVTFLDHLSTYFPSSTIIADVFPYSAINNPLTGERAFAWLYKLLQKARSRYRNSLFAFIFILRNLIQVGVSGDRRYGPIYNAGVAREIGQSLIRRGYKFDGQHPVWIMGWSGAGQIAVGAARFLKQLLHAPVYVISIGGVILDDPGIAEINHLYHLEGSRDSFPRLGDFLSPGRWPIFRRSAWNTALDQGRITVVEPGPMKHTGTNDYFDNKAILSSGLTHAQRTAQVISGIILHAHEGAELPGSGQHSQQ